LSEISEVKLRLLKATNDQDAVSRYIKGHEEVLLNNGVSLTKGYDYWRELDSVYLLIAESVDSLICYGGARLHIWNGTDPLPMQLFLSNLEPRIFVNLDLYASQNQGIVEIGGLWNSRAVAGLGLGSEHIIRTSIAATAFLEPKNVFTFCSPFVSRFADDFGFSAYGSLGDNGKFPFPDDRWMSTINYLEDKYELVNAKSEEREKIKSIRDNRVSQKVFTDRGRNLKIHFEI
jgi:hypothetical protein